MFPNLHIYVAASLDLERFPNCKKLQWYALFSDFLVLSTTQNVMSTIILKQSNVSTKNIGLHCIGNVSLLKSEL